MQEQAVRLAGEVDRLRGALEASHSDAAQLRLRNSDLQDCLDLNNDEFARIIALTDNSEIRELCNRARRRTWQTVPMIEQLEAANAECEALKRLRDELIRQQNESWHRRAEQLARDIDELRERAEVAEAVLKP